MTPAEREELELLRLCRRPRPQDIRRLIELERMDAATKCSVCRIEANTEEAIKDGTLPVLELPIEPWRMTLADLRKAVPMAGTHAMRLSQQKMLAALLSLENLSHAADSRNPIELTRELLDADPDHGFFHFDPGVFQWNAIADRYEARGKYGELMRIQVDEIMVCINTHGNALVSA